MTTLRQAAEQALEALERYQVKRQDFDRFADEITALREALAQREWVGLTDEERYLNDSRTEEEIEYARAIEAKLKEKNT